MLSRRETDSISKRERSRSRTWPGLAASTAPPSPPSARQLTPETTLGNRFRIESFLDRGGMGAVYRAVDLRSPTLARVAVKVFTGSARTDPLGYQRFRNEVALASGLTGHHFPRVHGFGVDGNIAYLAMELLEGETLRARLERVGRLTPAEVRWLVREACAALTAAHDRGVIHRDITPKNLFIVQGPAGDELRVLDLGIAKHALFDTKLTAPGMRVGSPQYMSPEQLTESRADERSDLWSLAVIVYRALVGRRPFDGDSPLSFIHATLGERAPRPSSCRPGLGPAIDTFFEVALAKDPARRWRDAKSFAAAFDAASRRIAAAAAEAESRAKLGDDIPTVQRSSVDRNTPTVPAPSLRGGSRPLPRRIGVGSVPRG